MKAFVHLRQHTDGRYYVSVPGFPIDRNTGWFVVDCVNPELDKRLFFCLHTSSATDLVQLGYEGGEDKRITTTKHIFDGGELVAYLDKPLHPVEDLFLPPDNPFLGRGQTSSVYAELVFRGDPGLGYKEYVDCEPIRRIRSDVYDWIVVATNVPHEGYQVGDVLADLESFYFTPLIRSLSDDEAGAQLLAALY